MISSVSFKKQKFSCSNHGPGKSIFALRSGRDFLMCVCHRRADVSPVKSDFPHTAILAENQDVGL